MDRINKNTHYVIDNTRCLAEKCLGFVCVVYDPILAIGQDTIINISKWNKDEDRYDSLINIDTSLAKDIDEFIDIIKAGIDSFYGRSKNNIVYFSNLSQYKVCEEGSIAFYTIFPYKLSITSTDGIDTYSDVRYLCNFISKRYSICKDKDDSMNLRSNVVCKDDYQYNPSTSDYCKMKYPIILQNCKLCNNCFNMCNHANAIRNSITMERSLIDNVCQSGFENLFKDTLYSNQQSKDGENVFPE